MENKETKTLENIPEIKDIPIETEKLVELKIQSYDVKKSNKKYKYDSRLVGKRRIFDQKLHDMYDVPARNVIKEKLGDYIMDNPDIYNQDMIFTCDTCRFKYLEIQVITQWRDEYPYKNVYVYERKAKYGNDTLYLTLNRDLTKGFLFDRKSFDGVKPRRFIKYSREFVYDIPWNKILPFCVELLSSYVIELY